MPGLNRHSGVVSYGIDNRNNKIAEPVMELILLALIIAFITRIGDSRDKYGTSDQPEHTKFHRWDT